MGRDLSIFLSGGLFHRHPLLKDPFAVFSLAWFAERLNCQIVVTVRHPAGFASSLKRLNWSFDFQDLLNQPLLMRDWLEPYRSLMLGIREDDIIGQASLLWAMIYRSVQAICQQMPAVRIVRHACDVMLTYTVVWDIDLPPGRLRDHRLRTRGWTVVSPQNQHLDVWGTISAPDVYRLGQIDNREDLKRVAILMYRSCGQMIDPWGSQGEQLHHTNYIQRNQAFDILKLRGDYNEQWTVFWVTAHFLTGAARFAEMGVPIWAQ